MWIDQTRRVVQNSKRDLSISILGLKQQVMTTITSVENAYYDLIFAKENVLVQSNALVVAKRLLEDNQKRVDVGDMAPLDVEQAKAQVATGEADLLAARQGLETQENLLKNLLTDDYMSIQAAEIDPASKLSDVPMVFQLSDSWFKGMTLRPDLQQFRLDLQKLDIDISYAKNQMFPALDLIASYGQNALNLDYGNVVNDFSSFNNPSYSVGIVFSVPLGNRTARNNYKATQAAKKQSLLSLKKAEQSVMVEIDNAVGQAQTSYQRVIATRQASIFAKAAMEAEETKLAHGKSTSFVVLQLQRDYTSAQASEKRALADYNIALSNLSLAEGSTLERHHIVVQSDYP